MVAVERYQSDRVIMDLLRYWESLRAGRIAPLRSEIDPRQIKSALGLTFILDVDPIGGIRFRLAGDKFRDLMGMELRGMPARSVIEPCHRDEFDASLLNMTRKPEILEYRLTAEGIGKSAPGARMLLLPMQGGDTRINRILGCLSLRSPVFDPPLRFQILDTFRTRIVTAPTAAQGAGHCEGFAEGAAAFIPAGGSVSSGRPGDHTPQSEGRPPSGAAHLRVVSDNYGMTR